MESVHCYSCFCFPTKEIGFFISNCMHIFCAKCKGQLFEKSTIKCTECQKTGIKLLKMGPNMPQQVRQMFTQISDDCQKFLHEMTRVTTFQKKQMTSLLSGLNKKEANFDKLRVAYSEEKAKKEHYKKQLEQAYRMLRKQNAEISDLKSISAETNVIAPPHPPAPATSISSIKVFSDSMYKTPKNQKKQLPAFLRTKSLTVKPTKQPLPVPLESENPFETPRNPPKTSLGFTTPKNPPNMFPHLKKNVLVKQNSQ